LVDECDRLAASRGIEAVDREGGVQGGTQCESGEEKGFSWHRWRRPE
jgi:hypothetical protein